MMYTHFQEIKVIFCKSFKDFFHLFFLGSNKKGDKNIVKYQNSACFQFTNETHKFQSRDFCLSIMCSSC